ncbi:ribonuclease P protein component, partial [Myxococcota bacterium]|nr:ribonuclease P protein component [Myxococcota bacterium]
YRLLKREQFLSVQSSPSRFVSKHLVFLYHDNSLGHVRVGFTVSKRHGKAVVRNKIKRRLRSAVRLLMPQLHLLGFDVVIIPKVGTDSQSSLDLMTEVSSFARRVKGI